MIDDTRQGASPDAGTSPRSSPSAERRASPSINPLNKCNRPFPKYVKMALTAWYSE
jgi:hypothetical protein